MSRQNVLTFQTGPVSGAQAGGGDQEAVETGWEVSYPAFLLLQSRLFYKDM